MNEFAEEYGADAARRMRETKAEVQRRNSEAKAAHWTAARLEVEGLEAGGLSPAEIASELARRWSALVYMYPEEVHYPGPLQEAVTAVARNLYMPMNGPLEEFTINRRDLVEWGVCETVADAGLLMRDLAAGGYLGIGTPGRQQRWHIPLLAVCPAPSPYAVLDWYDDGDDVVIHACNMLDGGWTAPAHWTLEFAEEIEAEALEAAGGE